jgi:hypothetical protein
VISSSDLHGYSTSYGNAADPKDLEFDISAAFKGLNVTVQSEHESQNISQPPPTQAGIVWLNVIETYGL